MALFANAAVFVILYVLFMLPTYLLPFLGSNSTTLNTLGVAAGAGLYPLLYVHLGALALLVAVAWIRGIYVAKQWIMIFPVLAAVFDVIPMLSYIPLVPTIMHLSTIIIGVASAPKIPITAPTAEVSLRRTPSNIHPVIPVALLVLLAYFAAGIFLKGNFSKLWGEAQVRNTSATHSAASNDGSDTQPRANTAGNSVENAYVNTLQLNLRSGPGTDYGIVTKLSQGDAVTWLERTQNHDGSTWVRVRAGAFEGWVNEKLLSKDPTNSSSASSRSESAPVSTVSPTLISSGATSSHVAQLDKDERGSEVSITLINKNCWPQDFYLNDQLLATIPARMSQLSTVRPGTYTTKACTEGTSDCGDAILISWTAGTTTHTISPHPTCTAPDSVDVARSAAEQRERDQNELNKYIKLIRTQIGNTFNYPERGLSCELLIKMVPGGDVVDAKVIRSSGNAVFDRQAKIAVRKASPLPVPDDPRLFQQLREIQFVFEPEV
ncbi:MAG: TonB family protein [Gammaproteobacteria bacterium]